MLKFLQKVMVVCLVMLLTSPLTIFAKEQKKMPIYSVDTDKKVVAITFDAAWGADDTDLLLEILAEHECIATFFVCGYWASKYADQLKKIAAAGHDIGNHGDSHAHVASLNFDQNLEEIARAHQRVRDILGLEMDLYRTPYGEYNNVVLEAAEHLKYYTIQWDVDSLDWKRQGVDAIVRRVLDSKSLQNGSILLFHNDLPHTPDALRIILKALRERGYGFVPVSALIMRDNFRLDHTGRQFAQ
ncbi:MAG: polysaccharide deacetylase family protein [Defluviitaleaceae bacterium]|nr:polysaccharide deacetylase family protein [Defluviitaleaceae bacterium]